MTEPTETLSEIEAIKRGLSSRDRELQADAERMLHRMGTQGVDVLLAILREERKRSKHRLRLVWPLLILSAVVLLLICSFASHRLGAGAGGVIGAICGIAVNVIFSVLRIPSPLYRKTLELLTQQNDLRVIGPLIRWWTAEGGEDKSVKEALARLLPRLQASDAALLDRADRERLYKEMAHSYHWDHGRFTDESLVVAILKALEQVGDAEAIPHLERLIEKTQKIRVHRAARDCLAFVQERATQRLVSSTLLRAADAHAAAPNELLRAGFPTKEREPQQLLRATNGSHERSE